MTAALAARVAQAPAPPPQPEPKRGDGRYRTQYREHAATTPWGTEPQGCGASVLVRVHDGQVQVNPILCDTWACGLCGPKRAAWLKREVHKALFGYRLKYFWTLTVSTRRCTAAESFKVITAAWNTLRTNLKRDYGPFSYIWVMEATQQGYAHLHLLTSLDITQKELKRRWYHATGGSHQAKADRMATDRASNYLTKYLAKESHERRKQGNDTLWHRHAYGKSRDVRLRCFRCRQVHDVGQVKCSDLDEGWYRWKQPYKDAVELLSYELELQTSKTEKTPYAALRASEGLDNVALAGWLDGLETESERWEDPEAIVDDPVEDLPGELLEMDAFMSAMGMTPTAARDEA